MVTKDESFLRKQFLFPRLSAITFEVILHALSEAIQQTVRAFRSDCSEWEGEVRDLFDDIDRYLATARRDEIESTTASVAQDVAGLKGLVEQQTEVLTALVNALTGQSTSADVANEAAQRTVRPPEPEFDPFERLQQAVTAASKTS